MTKKMNKRVSFVVKKKKKASRPAPRKEMTRLGSALRTLGGLGGSALGAFVGQGAAGSNLGTRLGGTISRWLGSGDYSVSSNSVVQRAGGSIPSMHKSDQTITIRHKEFLGEIRGTQEFAVRRTLNLNPGLGETFPWASSVAARFQEYRIKGLVFHYVPTSGTAISSSNAALGSVMIQTTYRAGDSAPTSKSEMLNEYWASEGRPCDDFCHPIECDPKENPYNLHYIRSGDLPSGNDQLLYDLGTTWVATAGMQSDDQIVGDLWVTYEIELKKPVMASNVASRSTLSAFSVADVAGSITGTSLFTGTLSSGAGSDTSITLVGNTITIPATRVGMFYVCVEVEATTSFTAATVSSTASVTGCIAIPFTKSSGVARTTLGGTGTLTRFFYCIAISKTLTSTAAIITIPAVTLTGAAARTDVMIGNALYPVWT